MLNDETAYSEVQREKQNDYFLNAIVPMCVPGGQILVIGTPFHAGDLYGYLDKRAKAFKCVRYPAILDIGTENERALWPERYSLEELYERRDDVVGTIRFAREYLVQPISDDLSLFPRHLFQGKPVEQPTLKMGNPEFWRQLDLSIYQGVDFAIGTRADADFTVIFTLGLDPRGNRWILDIERLHGASYREQKSAIIRSARLWKPDLMFLESNQMQAIFGQELRQDTDLPIKEFHTTGLAKHSLEKGLPSLRTLLENGKFRIPRGDARSVEMTDKWIAELNSFLFDKGKVQSIGDHDDIAMSCWIADQAARTGAAFSATFAIEDTYDRREQKRVKRGEKIKLPTVEELITEQTGINPTTGRLEHPDPNLDRAPGESDPFTGLPLNADGNVIHELDEGAPSAATMLNRW